MEVVNPTVRNGGEDINSWKDGREYWPPPGCHKQDGFQRHDPPVSDGIGRAAIIRNTDLDLVSTQEVPDNLHHAVASQLRLR